MATEPAPFRSATPAQAVDDLRRRLRSTRWPDEPAAAGWSLGTDVAYLRELCAYWADGFDWAAQEAALDALPRFRVQVGGLDVHVIHARAVPSGGSGGSGGASAGRAMPLVLSHGWPDSCWRYLKVLPLLVDPAAHGGDPADAFDVVVPDLPGFGWSERPATPLDSVQVAGLWAELMTTLGYERFGAAGGDLGSHVSRYLALDHPDRVVAVHRTDGGLPSPAALPDDLTPEEQEWVRSAGAWGASEGAYAAVHRTKPQTAAAGLNDSPAGLAAWIVEKLRSWSDCGGDLGSVYTPDEILLNLSIYWFTETIGSSMRMYAANGALPASQLTRRVEVPSGFSLFPGDILTPPRAWLERTTNLVSLTEPARGGHFAAFEQPELYAEELRTFFRPYRALVG
ncbi:epoxide hydrolase family protein [Microlunatus flavus]|uniref:Pimeloyl-ACP methyl ester carboxylesterase n=1 Tax=Microlunatus flavus TaxID=1036181 RepID=A0A1H9ENS1_9ACTN|nr:epoxide hydrolase family protein [Microlunatus flavus]SEQ27227.1 Pimeloyl-ACP methyl ester carboxylesterase [Microlunatus flavus]